MANYTKADLALRVLQDLGVVGSDETPQAADLLYATQTIDSEMALLEAKGIKMWSTDAESIHPTYLTALAARMALAIGPQFGIMTRADAEAAKERAESVLWTLGAPTLVPTPMRLEFAARGYARR